MSSLSHLYKLNPRYNGNGLWMYTQAKEQTVALQCLLSDCMITSPKGSDQLNILHISSSQENVSHFQVIIDVFSKESLLGKIS